MRYCNESQASADSHPASRAHWKYSRDPGWQFDWECRETNELYDTCIKVFFFINCIKNFSGFSTFSLYLDASLKVNSADSTRIHPKSYLQHTNISNILQYLEFIYQSFIKHLQCEYMQHFSSHFNYFNEHKLCNEVI